MAKKVPNNSLPAAPGADGFAHPEPPAHAVGAADKLLRSAQRLQAPAVAKYVNKIRASHPDESPQQIIERLEKQYLVAVTGTGGAVGATAAFPGVGTIAALSAVAGESLFFLEASALLALAIAEVHGIEPADQKRRESLVLSVALGEEGMSALSRLVGSTRSTAIKQLSSTAIPGANLSAFNQKMLNKVLRKFTVKRAPMILGKLLPAGIGAGIGAVGNRALGKKIIANARASFGPPPNRWPAELVIDGSLADEPALPGAPGQVFIPR
ncbi:hypothetical protein HUN08_06170 [Gordonia sp. X0973]|uniref:hypothetical protein n=1 Tax=Gordonia sp. X0973 TaxID=2742602 RepID=UPI00158277BA|nr:hypothetical protein [Gordonia sp. X0973]QKT06826.1 hypothetical protein HUN08_06170 [Gordonia sp. X0973]